MLISSKTNKIVLTEDKNQNVTQQVLENEFPGILHNKLSKEKLYKISCFELGKNYIKSPEEVIEILGWNNNLKKFLSRFISYYMDIKHYLKYKKNLRND